MITSTKLGGRTVELFVPFEFNGKQIERIVFGPFKLGHVLLWNQGRWQSQFDLMVELSGEQEAVLRELRFPDADRVMEAFFALLTPEVRNDIANGEIPIKQETDEPAPARVTNGSGEPVATAPGVPIPPEMEPGFDLTEEP
jgi:hypothetical protein